jgi:hypothetical protein
MQLTSTLSQILTKQGQLQLAHLVTDKPFEIAVEPVQAEAPIGPDTPIDVRVSLGQHPDGDGFLIKAQTFMHNLGFDSVGPDGGHLSGITAGEYLNRLCGAVEIAPYGTQTLTEMELQKNTRDHRVYLDGGDAADEPTPGRPANWTDAVRSPASRSGDRLP